MEEANFVTKFSLFFAKRYRLTILLFISTLFFGYVSYTSLLKREGFPSVDVPYAMVQTSYFVNDPNLVDENITSPLEQAIEKIDIVEEVTSNTDANFSVVIAQFREGTTTKEGANLLRTEVLDSIKLPETANSEIVTVDATKFNGKYDLVFTIYSDKNEVELQTKAENISKDISNLDEVIKAEPIDITTTQVDPKTGQSFPYQKRFNKVGIKEDETVKFYPAISIGVIQKEGVEAKELSDSVRGKIGELESDGSLDEYNVVYTSDVAEVLDSQFSSLFSNGYMGLIIVIIILFFFINWRASIIAAIFMPTVILSTFFGLYLFGYTLNVISLFGLILVLGLFVDDAIVVIESIDRKRQDGYKGLDAIKSAINDIGLADITGTATTILVFLPLAFISGILGDFIRAVPVTVIVALVSSVIIALSFVPLLSRVFILGLNRTEKSSKAIYRYLDLVFYGFSKLIDNIGYYSSSFVSKYLSSKFYLSLIILATLTTIGLGLFAASKLSFEVFPDPKDTDSFNTIISFEEGTNIERAQSITDEVAQVIVNSAKNHIERIDYLEGTRQLASLQINLVPMNQRDITSTQIVENIDRELENYQKARISTQLQSAGPPPQEYVISVRVYSDDTKTLEVATNDISLYVGNLQLEEGRIEEVVIDKIITISKIDGRRYAEVKIKTDQPNNTGLTLEVIDNIESFYTGERLSTLGLEEDSIEFDLGLEGESLDSFKSALIALVAALFLMYGLLVFKYDSFLQPILIFMAIPLAFPMLFPGLLWTKNPLSFFIVVGSIGLIGIVVNNTIMLMDFANANRAKGRGISESISSAIKLRFRPIVTTTATTILALLPLALMDPFWEPLAYTIIFGLLSSTIFVLLAFPAFYAIFEKIRDYKFKITSKFEIAQ